MDRVLIIAEREDSREAAFLISEELRANGYAIDFCNASDTSKIKADKVLEDGASPSGYKGVVFLDDGGDAEAAVSLAKKAVKDKMIVGGYGAGAIVIGDAGAFKGQYAPAEIAKQYKGKPVDAPAARSGDVISSLGSCPIGFAALLVDALGGQVKNVVTADISGAMLVISAEPWTAYWPLQASFRERGSSILVARWSDIDVKGQTASGILLGDGDVKPVKGRIPQRFWVQQDLSHEDVKSLENIGRRGTSTSCSIAALSAGDKIMSALASIFPQPQPIRSNSITSSEAMSGSYDVLSSSGKKIARIMGKGDYAIVSKNGQNVICSHADLEDVLAAGPLASAVSSTASIGGKEVEFCCFMAKPKEEWEMLASAAIVDGVSYPVRQAASVCLGSPEAASDLAEIASMACEVVDRLAAGSTDVAVFIAAGDNGPHVRVEPAPRYYVFSNKADMSRIAQMMGAVAPTDSQPTNHERISDFVVPSNHAAIQAAILEREMSKEGIWPQPGGLIAMDTADGTRRVQLDEAIDLARRWAIKTLDKEASCDGCQPKEARRAHLASLRARHRLMLLVMYAKAKSSKGVKTAGIYGTSIAGPYANLDLPWSERVMEWREADDFLTDRDKAIRNQPRYNPEYERTSDKDEFGFYYRWEDWQRSPYYWSRRLTDGTYPSTMLLQNNPRGN